MVHPEFPGGTFTANCSRHTPCAARIYGTQMRLPHWNPTGYPRRPLNIPAGQRTGRRSPLPDPMGPTHSPVFAFSPTCSGRIPRIWAMRPRTAALYGASFRPLREDDTVQVADPPAELRHRLPCGKEHFRQSRPDSRDPYRETSRRCRPTPQHQQRVGDRVQQDIGITVADHLPIVGHIDPPNFNGPPIANRCVSCPIPTRENAVIPSPIPGNGSELLFAEYLTARRIISARLSSGNVRCAGQRGV